MYETIMGILGLSLDRNEYVADNCYDTGSGTYRVPESNPDSYPDDWDW